MGLRAIRTYPDPVLQRVSEPAKAVDGTVQTLLQDMAETMYAANGVGLAAPQVGVNSRLIVVDVQRGPEGSGLLKLINPRILHREGVVKNEEGCLSLPDLLVETERSERVKVEALLPDGTFTLIEADGLLSLALQHEIDHLDGILLVDRLSRLRRQLYQRKRVREEARASCA